MDAIETALLMLKAGKLVAIPTETVYGLAADARNPEAIKAVFKAKGRPMTHPLIVHIHNTNLLIDWAVDIPAAAYTLAQHFWPGPLTLILKKATAVSPLITGGQDTVALRSPRHPLTQALLEKCQSGLVAPSANRYCGISPTTAQNVVDELGDQVDFVLDGGPCEVGIESTIVDLSSKPYTLMRQGMISQSDIETVLGQTLQKAGTTHVTKAPGQDKRHYAPKKPTFLVVAEELEGALNNFSHRELRIALLSATVPSLSSGLTWFAMPESPAAYARTLYSKMRLADQSKADCIIIESVPSAEPAWAGILDRLTRASSPLEIRDQQ